MTLVAGTFTSRSERKGGGVLPKLSRILPGQSFAHGRVGVKLTVKLRTLHEAAPEQMDMLQRVVAKQVFQRLIPNLNGLYDLVQHHNQVHRVEAEARDSAHTTVSETIGITTTDAVVTIKITCCLKCDVDPVLLRAALVHYVAPHVSKQVMRFTSAQEIREATEAISCQAYPHIHGFPPFMLPGVQMAVEGSERQGSPDIHQGGYL